VKLLTRKEKMNKVLMSLYTKYVDEGMKPERAAERAREEAGKQQLALNLKNSFKNYTYLP